MLHFLSYLREAVPQASFSEHGDTGVILMTTNQDYLVARLSQWPLMVEINKAKPFPHGIVPILFRDIPITPDTPQPKGRYLLANGRGLTWFLQGEKLEDKHLPHRTKACDPKCSECQLLINFEADYALPT